MNLAGKKVNFLGDSITFGGGVMVLPAGMELPPPPTEIPESAEMPLPPPENPFDHLDPDTFEDLFVNVLRRECKLAETRNYGKSGTRIARQQDAAHDWFPEYFRKRAERMNPDADIVLVFGGTNDFGHGDAPLGSGDDRTPDTFYGACHDLFRYLIEKYPRAVIVVCTPLHRSDEMNPRGDGSKKSDSPVLADYVQALRETAESYRLPVLDFFNDPAFQPWPPSMTIQFCPDGLHPNREGNLRIARQIKHYLSLLQEVKQK